MKMRYLAIDPGKTTGLALYDGETTEFEAYEREFLDAAKMVHTLVGTFGTDITLIAEAFLITAQTPKNTQAPWSLEMIGVARYLSCAYCGRDLVLQTPAAAKRFSSNDRLKIMNFWTPGLRGHANDAARHLLLYLGTTGKLDHETMKKLVG